MTRTRVRIRYRKLDDLRWLGHQDLVRVWERLLRRADVRPAHREGFHKRPKMNFPSALAVGIGLFEAIFWRGWVQNQTGLGGGRKSG